MKWIQYVGQSIYESKEGTVHIQQQKVHIKTSVVFPMTIFVYEPFKVHGGVLAINDIVIKQQHPSII